MRRAGGDSEHVIHPVSGGQISTAGREGERERESFMDHKEKVETNNVSALKLNVNVFILPSCLEYAFFVDLEHSKEKICPRKHLKLTPRVKKKSLNPQIMLIGTSTYSHQTFFVQYLQTGRQIKEHKNVSLITQLSCGNKTAISSPINT